MIKKIILYTFVFLISLCVFFLALMPAKFVWDEVLSEQLNPGRYGVQVQRVGGSPWQGQALVSYQGIVGLLDWDVNFAGLLKLNLPVNLGLESYIGQAKANVTMGLSDIKLHVAKADIDLKPLDPLFRAQRVNLDGQLLVRDLRVVLKEQRLDYAEGVASWSGGDIAYPAGREFHERTLPSFKAILETQGDGVIKAGVRDPGASFDVISADIAVDGTAMLRVTRRLLDLSDEPWSLNSREQDVVFKVKKQLY